MGKFLPIVAALIALAACAGPDETDYARPPGQTTVIENPDSSTTVITQPSEGTPLRLCQQNKPC